MTTLRPIKMTDVYAAGLCSSGLAIREFFRQNKLDFRKFLKQGISVEQIEALGDNAIARKVLEAYHERGQ